MKTTSDKHGYQIKIHTVTSEFLLNAGKVYRFAKVARTVASKLVNDLDAGNKVIEDYSYFEIVLWDANTQAIEDATREYANSF